MKDLKGIDCHAYLGSRLKIYRAWFTLVDYINAIKKLSQDEVNVLIEALERTREARL